MKLNLTRKLFRILQPEYQISEYEAPTLFNAEGDPIHTVYLQDTCAKHSPYSFVSGRLPKYILWDRNNYGLQTHVYSHREMLYPKGNPTKKFGFLIESEGIAAKDYELIASKRQEVNTLTGLFTHSESLLNQYSNALWIPGGGCWYGTGRHGGILDSKAYLQKTRNISIVASDKEYCALHSFRKQLALRMLEQNTGEVMGTVRGTYIKIADSLTNFRYSIAIENYASKFYFTEKLLNCFASMTVPIYYGATTISDFFNPDGIIQIKKPDVNEALQMLSLCTEQDYFDRVDAIKDNYARVQQYLSLEDYIFNHYSHLMF